MELHNVPLHNVKVETLKDLAIYLEKYRTNPLIMKYSRKGWTVYVDYTNQNMLTATTGTPYSIYTTQFLYELNQDLIKQNKRSKPLENELIKRYQEEQLNHAMEKPIR